MSYPGPCPSSCGTHGAFAVKRGGKSKGWDAAPRIGRDHSQRREGVGAGSSFQVELRNSGSKDVLKVVQGSWQRGQLLLVLFLALIGAL